LAVFLLICDQSVQTPAIAVNLQSDFLPLLVPFPHSQPFGHEFTHAGAECLKDVSLLFVNFPSVTFMVSTRPFSKLMILQSYHP